MRRKAGSAIPAVALFFLLLISSTGPLFSGQQYEPIESLRFESENPARAGSSNDIGVSDVPVWRIGDKWIYSGTFDPTTLIINSGVSASVGEINGDTTAEVTAIGEHTVDNMTVLAYTLRSYANFDKSGVELDGYDGNAYIEYTQTEVLRVSDLAAIRSDLDMYIKFVPYGISSLTRILGDITITTEYSPVNEVYDFPLREDERWTTTRTSSSTWSGTSDYITPFPAPTTDTNSTTWEVSDVGKPFNNRGQTIGYGGCNASYGLTSYDSDGDESGYRWYCPEVRNYAWMHTEEDVGLTIDFRLKQYIPKDSTGVDIYQNPGSRNRCIEIETTNPITALNAPTEVWVNASSTCFSNTGGLQLELRYETTGYLASLSTAANGSAWAIIDVSDKLDSTYYALDWASHAFVAKIANHLGVSTITLDEFMVGLDLISDLDSALVMRNRSGVVSELNSITGWNVLPEDHLFIEVSVKNRGITTSAPADMLITHPDGQSSRHLMPPLATYAVHKVNFTWTVPADSNIGIIPLSWQADPDNVNSADANATNNLAQLNLFVGRLPTVLTNNSSALTNQMTSIDASMSFDEDGGEVYCKFIVTFDDGSRQWNSETFISQSCMMNYSWIDDGLYPIEVIVVDDERDEISTTLIVEIINRPAKIEIRSARTEAKVEHPITLYAYANDSDSEKVWPGVVDVYWPNTICQEGYYTRVCTTTAPSEGWHSFMAVGEDDDFTKTTATIDIEFTNIAPHGTTIQLFDGSVALESDGQHIWQVDEDQLVNVKGQSEDSIDDIDQLTHTWWPDDAQPSLVKSFEGRVSQYPMHWSDSGLHIIRLQVTDSEGASSAVEERWVNVRNIAPTIEPLDQILPVAEGQEISLSASASDTASDISSLVRCWDIDPGIDSDDHGSAADDCDIRGDNLTYSWNRSGSHTIVYHVTDDDGAHSSEVLIVEVLNIPPKVRISDVTCMAYSECVLDASPTIDSANDIGDITIVWDLDISTDSNGDGIKDNDADLVGKTVSHIFRVAGINKVKAIAWDEDPERPGTAIKSIEVTPPERNIVEKISASLVGEEANVYSQLTLLAIVLATLTYFSRRRKIGKDYEMWPQLANIEDGFDEFGQPIDHLALQVEARRPQMAPPQHIFGTQMNVTAAIPEPYSTQNSENTTPQNPQNAQNSENLEDLQNSQSSQESTASENVPTQNSQKSPSDASISENIPTQNDSIPPPIPEDGLPEGWSEQQWQHFGQQYLDSIS